MLVIPLLSTVIAIGVIPYVSNWAYWASLEYKKKRRTMKEDYEKGRILTFEESAKIINDLNQSEEKFLKIIAQKEDASDEEDEVIENSDIQALIDSGDLNAEEEAELREYLARQDEDDEEPKEINLDEVRSMLENNELDSEEEQELSAYLKSKEQVVKKPKTFIKSDDVYLN